MGPKRDTVIFDMDGVLFDTERLMLKCWQKACGEYGIDDIDKIYPACIGTTGPTTIEIFNEYYANKYPFSEIQPKALEAMHEHIDHFGPPVMPFAPELLSSLYEEGFQIGLASSTFSDLIRKELSRAGLETYFSVVIGGDMIERGKPAPDIFLRACSELGRGPANVYVIEDSENGIRAAHAAGAIPIMVPDMVSPSDEILSMCAHVANDLKEVRDLLCY